MAKPDRPQLKIEYRNPAELKAYGKNSRTHSAAQIGKVRRSIEEFGFSNPILLMDDGVTIGAGHARQAASLLEPPLASVPTIILPGLSADQWRAYVIADNQLALDAGWDPAILAEELNALRGAGFDLSLTGFAAAALRAFMKPPGKTEPDALPEQPTPRSKLGDLWTLGDHRLICGSSTELEVVTRLFDGARPSIMVTDPPYGVNYDPNWRSAATGSKVRATGLVLNDDRADWSAAWAHFPGDVAYVWHGGLHAAEVQRSLDSVSLHARAQIIWVKPRLVMSRGAYHWRHEPCLFAVRAGPAEAKADAYLLGLDPDDAVPLELVDVAEPAHEGLWYSVRKGAKASYVGGRKQDTVWEIDNASIVNAAGQADVATYHGTQKPVECMKRPIENHGAAGDSVYEPFAGSFTTGIACEITDRRCFACELSPEYVDLGIARWESFTGQEAILEATGQTFAEVGAERAKEG